MRERNVTAGAAIDVGNTTEETGNVNETNPVPVQWRKLILLKIQKKVNSMGSVEISITT